jgi:hypothetical protein
VASTYRIERSQQVDAPSHVVQERVVDLRRWRSWSPWEGLDPEQSRTYGGPRSGVGAWCEWDGNRKAGRGRMEIVEADDSHVRIALQFLKPFRSRSTTEIAFAPQGEATLTTWTMTGQNTLMLRVMGIFTSMDKLIGPDLEQGLANLKAASEAGSRGTPDRD